MCGRDWSSDVCSSDLSSGIYFFFGNKWTWRTIGVPASGAITRTVVAGFSVFGNKDRFLSLLYVKCK
jgi:hypothetical protein